MWHLLAGKVMYSVMSVTKLNTGKIVSYTLMLSSHYFNSEHFIFCSELIKKGKLPIGIHCSVSNTAVNSVLIILCKHTMHHITNYINVL